MKEPFDVPAGLKRIEKAVRPYPKAAMFQLAEDGFDSIFEQLVGCILSIRTLDEVSLPAAEKLLSVARTPEQVAKLPSKIIEHLIRKTTFHFGKAQQIKEIARRALSEFDGELPADANALMRFKGVGPKCANLTLGVARKLPLLSVDVHVHRVTNRWGIIHEKTPEKSMEALKKIVPRRHWIDLNRLLVPFGKHICKGVLPRCSSCPVYSMCRQVGVTSFN